MFNSEYNSGGVKQTLKHLQCFSKEDSFLSKSLEIIKVLYIYHHLYKQPSLQYSYLLKYFAAKISFNVTIPNILIKLQISLKIFGTHTHTSTHTHTGIHNFHLTLLRPEAQPPFYLVKWRIL